ncbi:coil containing protein [Vibrio phage 1.244.A._10N.261.54.C3]|nr:coil containing protein [Vibrio phage 1.244.A._10N.261.54.C3]AUR98780.1 coil containing protein [Vibrio phage 1.255.O._10N.286.45.F1]
MSQEAKNLVIISESAPHSSFVAASMKANGYDVNVVSDQEFEAIREDQKKQNVVLGLVSSTMALVEHSYSQDISNVNKSIHACLGVMKQHFDAEQIEAARLEMIEIAKVNVRKEIERLAKLREDTAMKFLLDHLFNVLKYRDDAFYKDVLGLMDSAETATK